MTPRWGNNYSLPFLPATPSYPSRTLEGLFKLTWSPSRALNLNAYVASETTEEKKDTVKYGALGSEARRSNDTVNVKPKFLA